MTRNLLLPELWDRIKGMLPAPKSPGPKGGRRPTPDRNALQGIIYVLRTGIAWKYLPAEFGCSGMTCWRRLRDWQASGIWQQLQVQLLGELRAADKIDWNLAVVDSSNVRALGGGEDTGPNPTDRGKPGSKHHILIDANGIPLAEEVTAANVNDVIELIPLVVAIPPVAGKPGRPKSRPRVLQGDRGYDSEPARRILRWLGIKPLLARRRTEHGSGLGVTRWPVERTISWFHNFGRLRIRKDRRTDIHKAFMTLAASLICLTFVVS
jgi:transposase